MTFVPHFTSESTDIQHGLMLDAAYSIDFGPAGVHISMNPAWSFHVHPLTGMLQVLPIQQKVVVFNDLFGIKDGVQEALKVTFPEEIERGFAEQFTFTSPDMPFCDPSTSDAANQITCYLAAVNPAQQPALNLLREAFTDNGEPEAVADARAASAVTALEPRNFACDAELFRYAFHPVFKRIHVLPRTVGFVLADFGERDENRFDIYEALSILSGEKLCQGPPTSSSHGNIARHQSPKTTLPPGGTIGCDVDE